MKPTDLEGLGLILLALLMTTLPAFAQPPVARATASISGVVTAADGRPVAGAVVSVTNLDSAARTSTKTDRDGTFEVTTLAAGAYSVVCEKEGFSPAVAASISVAEAGKIELDLTLDADLGIHIEEMIVTAQKREENLQEVPVAVTALSAAILEDHGFDEINDLATAVPSLQFGNFGPVAFVAIRGIGHENTTAGGDPGVALHIDGVYLGRPVASLFNAFDMERVEILRGPQGTLYGRNATGGSINYISKAPTDRFEGELDLTAGEYSRVRLRGAVNLPLGDRSAARISFFREDRDGFTENTVPGGTEANDADNWGVRGSLRVDIGDRGDLVFTLNHIETGGVGTQPEVREPFPALLAGPPFGGSGPAGGIRGPGDWFVDANGNPLTNDLTPFREAKSLRERQENEFTLLTATLTYAFERFTLKTISAFAESSFESHQDSDSSAASLVELVLLEDAEQFSQEIQILSPGDRRLRWIAGLYYFEEEAFRTSDFFEDRFDFFARTLGVCCGVRLGGDVEAESLAVFGQVSYDLSETVSLTGGLRWTDDEKNGTNQNILFAPLEIDPVSTASDEVTWRLVLDWKISDDALLYAGASTGYKSGGINQVAITSAGRNAVYDPEFVDAFEVGLKSELFDRKLRLNISAFHNDYQDLQFQIFEFGGPAAFNAQGAQVTGLEIEFLRLLGDFTSIDGFLGYTDSEYDEQILSGVQLGGNQLSRTPEWTYGIGVNRSWVLDNGAVFRARADYSFTDDIFYTPFNRDDTAGPGGSDRAEQYDNIDLRLFWTHPSGAWTIEGFVTNLTDEVQEGNILRGIGFNDAPGGGGQEFVTYNPPRQWGLRVNYNF